MYIYQLAVKMNRRPRQVTISHVPMECPEVQEIKYLMFEGPNWNKMGKKFSMRIVCEQAVTGCWFFLSVLITLIYDVLFLRNLESVYVYSYTPLNRSRWYHHLH